MITSLIALFEKSLDTLAKEISLYPDESVLWQKEKEVNNPAGNLCLHLCGNLQHFIGAILGNTGYVRDRAMELSAHHVPSAKLILDIQKTKEVVTNTLSKLSTQSLQASYPIQVFGHEMSTTYFLIHLHGHLSYHLGQISYHRRLLV